MRKGKTKLIFLKENYDVSIWPLCMVGELLKYHLYKLAGENCGGEMIGEWKNRVNRWVVDPESYDKKISKKILKKVEKNPAWLQRNVRKIFSLSNQLIKYSQNIFDSNLKIKTDRELLKLYLGYREEFLKMYVYGWLPNLLEGRLNFFTAKLGESLKSKLEQAKKVEKIGQYLSLLTTPIKLTNREKERLEFLEIISVILKKRGVKNLFLKKSLKRAKNKLAEASFETYRLISAHQRKYCWLPFDYDGPAWTIEHFLAQAREIIVSGVEPAKEIRKLKKSKQQIKKLQKQYARELNLAKDKKLSYLLTLARELMFLKDYRKDALFKSYYHMDKLIREIGRRLSLTPIQVKHILPQEMEKVLVKRKYSVVEINQRIKYSVLLYKNSKKGFIPKNPIKIYTGKVAKKIVAEKISEEALDFDIKILAGQTAYPGEVKGRVRLVFSTQDLKKIRPGEILVSPSTNPNLLPAMRIAGAIITDMGGITSHAAIISRELKIPCVVGVKIATKVLKDGMAVEVDAGRGMVKILDI